jgi:dephospho-CoA kinase
MIVIGLTGSIAMGKSEVAKVMRQASLPVFDADKEVHALYDSAEGAHLLQQLIPEAVRDSRVDRQRLSRLVVDDPERLTQLEKTVHAEIARRRNMFIAKSEQDGFSTVVIDVPLLFEKGGDKDVDVTVVVSSPPEHQRQRALARPGMTEEKLAMILARQMPDAEKQKRADYVIQNNSTLADLRERTLDVLAAIRREHTL